MYGKSHFGLEQGLKVSAFLKLNTREERYFLWMIEWAKAGTGELKAYFADLLAHLREEHLQLKNRVGAKSTLNPEVAQTYYRQWYFVAIHILVTIEGYSSHEALGEALGLR